MGIMPTNDERREVAENLRSMCACGCRYAEQFYELLNETVMGEWDFHGFQDVADRLADLIEPEERTCRLTHDAVHNDMVCSSCGAWIDMVAYSEFEASGVMRHCPSCGARVVGE